MRIAYIDAQSYAGGIANSVRVNAMIEALELGGHEVLLYREEPGGEFDQPTRPFARLVMRTLPKAALLGRRVTAWLDGLDRLPDLVLVYGVDPRYLVRSQRWCLRHRVSLVVDVVDWYAAADLAGLGPKVFSQINDRWVMQSVLRRCDGAIVVSHLLERHCAALNVPTLRIPAAVSGLHTIRHTGARGFTMTYAGAPGAREAGVLINLRRLAREGELERLGIELQIIGLSACAESDLDNEHRVSYLGRLPREAALRHVVESSFTVLQRPANRRFAKAGFPSKVAESLLLGVPVIANLSGDLAEFLIDHRNAIVLSGDDYDALRDGVARAVTWAASVDNVAIASDATNQFSPRAIEPLLTEFLRSRAMGPRR